MRIAIVVPYGIETSGILVFINRLQKALEIKYIECCLLLPFKSDYLAGEGVTSHFIQFDDNKQLSIWLLDNPFQYDILFWAGFPKSEEIIRTQISLSADLAEKYNKKIYFLWERTGYKDVITNQDVFRLFTNTAKGIFVLNSAQKRQLLDNNVPESKIRLLSPGVDTTEFSPVSLEQKNTRRKNLGFNLEAITGLSVARFERRKRSELLIETWINHIFLNESHLIIVGTGFDRIDSTESIINDLISRSKNITLVKYHAGLNRSQFYQACDYFISAGTVEGEPSVISEAMACGLPVIASDIEGHKHLVRNNITGFLFNPDDENSLQVCLNRMIKNTELRLQMGRAARQLILKERDIFVVADKFISFLFS